MLARLQDTLKARGIGLPAQQPKPAATTPQAPAGAPLPQGPPSTEPKVGGIQREGHVEPSQAQPQAAVAQAPAAAAPVAAAPKPAVAPPPAITPSSSGATSTPPPANVGASGVVGTPITGQERPQQFMPQNNAAVTGLSNTMVTEAQRQMANPTVYDDDLFHKAKGVAAQGINDNYDHATTKLNSELASRGLNWGSTAGGRHGDLATSRARELSGLDTKLLQDRAQAMAAGRSSAFNNAAGAAGFVDNIDRANRNEARTERGYNDGRSDTAWNQGMTEATTQFGMDQQKQSQWQQSLDRALGYGQGGQAGQYLDAAGRGHASGAQASGQNAAGLEAAVAEVMRLWGGGG